MINLLLYSMSTIIIILELFPAFVRNFQFPVLIAESSFIEWLYWVFNNIASGKKEEIAITIWALWFARNKLLHNKKEQTMDEVITFIRGKSEF
ncbi:hypothetical protein Golax_023252 [Gossypium laxum]|uniref:Uncharacterized protein n=1 Tax=Gossypium laxum TaxID=34288 RepID=A0A7J9AYL7_9ROSI|nr:hypothetical protein [Gossypium laxum]